MLCWKVQFKEFATMSFNLRMYCLMLQCGKYNAKTKAISGTVIAMFLSWSRPGRTARAQAMPWLRCKHSNCSPSPQHHEKQRLYPFHNNASTTCLPNMSAMFTMLLHTYYAQGYKIVMVCRLLFYYHALHEMKFITKTNHNSKINHYITCSYINETIQLTVCCQDSWVKSRGLTFKLILKLIHILCYFSLVFISLVCFYKSTEKQQITMITWGHILLYIHACEDGCIHGYEQVVPFYEELGMLNWISKHAHPSNYNYT